MGQSASHPSSSRATGGDGEESFYSSSSDASRNLTAKNETDEEAVLAGTPLPAPPSLYELEDHELKTLLFESRPLSIEEIKNVASSIYDVKSKKYKVKPTKKKNNNDDVIENDNNLGFYSTEGDSDDIQLAIRINEISSSLSQKNRRNNKNININDTTIINNMRFKLVPSRMREDVFWESVFTILKERLVEQNARNQLDALEDDYNDDDDDDDDDDKDKNKKKDGSIVTSDNKMNGHKQQQQKHRMNGTISSSSSSKNIKKKQEQASSSSSADAALVVPDDDELLFVDDLDTSSLESQLALRNSQVIYLSRQVKQLRKQLQQQQQQHQNSAAATTTTTLTPKHQGHWIIDKDSKEFLEYPTELKENMRKAKSERLDLVKHEMKFILDSDQISDTNGYWDCCGSTGYHSSCDRTRETKENRG